MTSPQEVLDEMAVRHLDRRYPPPGHPGYREPDISADEWREAYFALAAIAQKQLDKLEWAALLFDQVRVPHLDVDRLELAILRGRGISMDRWIVEAVAREYAAVTGAMSDVDVTTLTDWLIEDVTAERATRQGNPESRESFRFVALRLLGRSLAIPPPGFVKATTIELENDIRELRGAEPGELARRLIERGWVQGKSWPEGR